MVHFPKLASLFYTNCFLLYNLLSVCYYPTGTMRDCGKAKSDDSIFIINQKYL